MIKSKVALLVSMLVLVLLIGGLVILFSPSIKSATSGKKVLGMKLGSALLHTQDKDILKIFGEPKLRTIAHGQGGPQWEYQNGLTIYIGSLPSSPTNLSVWQIVARPPFQEITAEGFQLGDTETTFKRIYADYHSASYYGNQLQIEDAQKTLLIVEFNANKEASLIILKMKAFDYSSVQP